MSTAGYELVHAKLEATWAEHCPAYYLAINTEERRLLISVRGTAEVEDVVTDLIASPEVRAMARIMAVHFPPCTCADCPCSKLCTT